MYPPRRRWNPEIDVPEELQEQVDAFHEELGHLAAVADTLSDSVDAYGMSPWSNAQLYNALAQLADNLLHARNQFKVRTERAFGRGGTALIRRRPQSSIFRKRYQQAKKERG
jgi:hypothetical protein